jgi:hypothetical protein
MEAICSFETSVETQRTTRRHILEDDTLLNNYMFLGYILSVKNSKISLTQENQCLLSTVAFVRFVTYIVRLLGYFLWDM